MQAKQHVESHRNAKQMPLEPTNLTMKDDVGEEITIETETGGVCINSNFVRVSGGDYLRRSNAPKATLGSYGNLEACRGFRQCKMDFYEVGHESWLKPVDKMVSIHTTVTLTAKQTSSLDASAQIDAAKVAAAAGSGGAGSKLPASVNVSVGHNSNSNSDQDFKAVYLGFTSRRQLIKNINADPEVLADFKRLKQPRVVYNILRLELPGSFNDDSCVKNNAKVTADDMGSANVESEACQEMAASFSAKTVIAFDLYKPEWDDIKTKKRVVDLVVDQPCSWWSRWCGCR